MDIHTVSTDGVERVVRGFKINPYNIPDRLLRGVLS